MAWLRLDDGFAQHPKIVSLTPKDRWTWLELLSYCARYRTEGRVPEGIAEVVRGCTPAFLTRCGDLRLLDAPADDEPGYLVHDWADYNPSRLDDVDEAVAAFLTDNPQASANEVARNIGGSRNGVLAAVKRYRAGTPPVPTADTGTGIARASRPVPSPSTSSTAGAGLNQPPPRTPFEVPAAAFELDTINPTTDLDFGPNTADPIIKLVLELRDRDAGTEHTIRKSFGGLPDAAFAYTLEEVQRCRHDTDSDAGLAVRVLQRIADTGLIGDPDHAPGANGVAQSPARAQAPPDPADRRERYVRGDGRLLPADELEFQLKQLGAGDDELVELLDLAADLRRGVAT